MAFSGKYKIPKSRRQVWDRFHSTLREKPKSASQYGRSFHLDGSRDTDIPASGRAVASAGAPCRRSTEKTKALSPQIELPNITIRMGVAVVPTVDSVDTPGKIQFSKVDIFFVCLSIILYVGDIGLDCFVAYKHYLHIDEDPLDFAFTLAFVLLAGIVTSVFSLWWYYFEYQTKKATPEDLPTTTGLTLRIIACIFMMGPVVRYIDTIMYGLRSRQKGVSSSKRQYYHEQMQFERVDGAMLRLFEAFLESAPQFLLQVFIVFQKGLEGEKDGNYILVSVTIASIASSMVSLAWSVVAYHKALRMSRHDLQNISHLGLAFRFIWRLFEISPRIIILAMFMSAFGPYVGMFAAIHFVLMLMWLQQQQTNFCEKPGCEIFFIIVMALIWCFCFFNLKDGRTRRTSLAYYILFFLENVGLTVAWYVKTREEDIWYRSVIIVVVLGSIVPMVTSMLIYYKCFHKQEIATCLPASYWTSCDLGDQTSVPRYGAQDGTVGERAGLTENKGDMQETSPTPPEKLDSTSSISDPFGEELDTDNAELPFSSIPPYQAPTPEPDSRMAYEGDGEPNLDDCVEVNGYLEASALAKRSSRLVRMDTMPKYTAPVPSNYGATVPGGAPAVYTLSIRAPADPAHGSTLPGAPAVATVVNNGEFVPYEEDSSVHHPQTTLTRSPIDKPPVPQPRLSTLHHGVNQSVLSAHENSQSQSPPHEETDLTNVSELSNNNSGFLNNSTHSLRNHPAADSHNLSVTSNLSSDEGLDTSSVDTDGLPKRHSSADAVDEVSVSSLDTPLKDGKSLQRSLNLSIDTPVKEALKARHAANSTP